MKKLYVALRIGEKIGISFGLVGVLFLAVIWGYHQTLQHSLSEYQRLVGTYSARQVHALAIEGQLLATRNAEKDFLLYRRESDAAAVVEGVEALQVEAGRLATFGAEDARAGSRIRQLILTYQQRFDAIATAWRRKGLDHDSGLQGQFRDTVHQLEALAGHFKVDDLYLQLLQMRRAEKDLGLRREARYRDKALALVDGMERKIRASGLDPELQRQLAGETAGYRSAFLAYAADALSQQDLHGGKGPFRQVAHRIEDLLTAHYIPDMESHILQLRRREKDYLLRGDRKYVDMALAELAVLQRQVERSTVAPRDKARMTGLLDDYRRDFLALVQQNTQIDRLHGQMQQAAQQITPLVQSYVQTAKTTLGQATEAVAAGSRTDARLMAWIAVLATLLGIASALVITLSIARPLRHMAGLLNQLAYEEQVERVPAIEGGRDEVNAMAQSVNTMADHRARFLAWWKASMREAAACEQLADGATDTDEGRLELSRARRERADLAGGLHRDIQAQAQQIGECAGRLAQICPQGRPAEESWTIGQAAKAVLSSVDILLTPPVARLDSRRPESSE